MPPKVKRVSTPAAKTAPSKYHLAEKILQLSNANDWDSAKEEWTLDSIFHSDEPGTCLCGHFPINEHCVIVNLKNGNEAIVGNVCVKKFLGLPSDKLFTGINRIIAKIKSALNVETIDYARNKGWISAWDKKFYMDTRRRRWMSDSQWAQRERINKQILHCFRKSQR